MLLQAFQKKKNSIPHDLGFSQLEQKSFFISEAKIKISKNPWDQPSCENLKVKVKMCEIESMKVKICN